MNFFRNPAVRGDHHGNFHLLVETTEATLKDDVDCVKHTTMLAALDDDTQEGGVTYLGLRRAPAAKGNHHAFEGGLVYHLLEMWSAWQILRQDLRSEPYISDERVLKAILYHDLHKAHRTYVLKGTDPWETEYGTDPTDLLMTNDTKSLWILSQHDIKLDPEQTNALLWAEGGFAKIRPKQCSALAKLCYCLDELSGNVAGRIETRTLIDLKKAEP